MAADAHPLAALRQSALHYSLSRSPIFSGLPGDDLTRIAGYAELRTLRRGAYLFREGDPVAGFFIVRRGLIHVYRFSAESGAQIIHLLHPGDSFAERAIGAAEGYPASARAVKESEVILIPTAPFQRHQRDRPDLAWRMVSAMSHHLRSLVTTLEGLRFIDAEARLVHWILQRCPLSSRQPMEIALGMKQETLARELAIRRETLSRLLRRLRSRGLAQTAGHSRLRVLDVSRLRSHFETLTSEHEGNSA